MPLVQNSRKRQTYRQARYSAALRHRVGKGYRVLQRRVYRGQVAEARVTLYEQRS
ncbi:hypothetical protein E2C01_086072 [Portunus trituberculatus]|uniref:Uncharacterized protein n=1 Tax=Portunus trituberculatus TaxID=210409 RepID=A0A5B7J8B2_PORTR|nr:hypothetical protein [Portunus trituberculatus]